MWVPVDATGEDFYELGSRYGTQVGVLSELHPETNHPFVAEKHGAGFFDPRCLRWHSLQREVPPGVMDNRLAIQVVNDYFGEYEDVRPDDAPFGQPEYFTALNRSTREVDTQGRVALPSSHRRVIDSEDDRYALALTCRSVPLHAAETQIPEDDEGGTDGAAIPSDVAFRKAGTDDEGSHGGVTRTRPSVSVGGVTFFGRGAVAAAQDALAKGGTSADAARFASAAARGLPMPPLLGRTAERKKRDPGPTSERKKADDKDPGWGVPILDHPAGYVWSTADVIGLLGTLVVPEGAGGSYFSGREGTPIGPLPWRHDAQVSMGKDLVGRIVFVSNDAAELPEGKGKLVKGEMWRDTSRANQDTELGLETCQWRPVVPVDADLPPSRPPPWDPPWIDPPEDDDDEDDDDAKKKRKKPKRPPTGGRGRGRGKPGEGDDEDLGDGTQGREISPTPDGGDGGVDTYSPGRLPGPTRDVEPGGDDGVLPRVKNPGAQARDYAGLGEPCPNSTAGTLRLHNLDDDGSRFDPRGFGLKPVPGGGYVEFFGHPALNLTAEGLSVGGFEGVPDKGHSGPRGVTVGPPSDDPGRVPLGLPRGKRTGVDVGPPSDEPGRVPLGLPRKKRRRPGGFDIDPPLGGDRGIPRGSEERWRRRQRRERARRAREARDRREKKRLDELEDMEERARRKGKTRLADRIKRAREKINKRRKKRAEKKKRREDYRKKLEKEREERKKKREERRKRRREERKRKRAERRARLKEKRKKKRSLPQGGYVIDTTYEESREISEKKLDPEQKRRLEEDRKKEKARRKRQRELWEEEARFGDWNVANARLPFFGSIGGPSSLEGWSHLVTYQVRAMQRVVTGAFGGPSYLAANLGVMHRNRPGNPPTGSRIGAWWTAVAGQKLDVRSAPVEVVSVLEAQAGGVVCATTGGVLEVAREHRSEGFIEDSRPLVLLRNGGADADLVADVKRRFVVTHEGCAHVACLHALGQEGDGGRLLEVGRVDAFGQVQERYLTVEPDGTVCVFKDLKVLGERTPSESEVLPGIPLGAVVAFAGEEVPEGYEVWEGEPPSRWLMRTG